MATNGRAAATGTGVRRAVRVPSPSWPLALSPQQSARPSGVRAQAWRQPTASATARTPATGAGMARWRPVPSPSCPEVFAPQQATVPLVVMAQV
jgi:hypothetical protein